MTISVYQPRSAADLVEHYARVRSRFSEKVRESEYAKEKSGLQAQIAKLMARIAELEGSLETVVIENRKLKMDAHHLIESCNDIITIVCQRWRVGANEVLSTRRTANVTEPRQIAMALCHMKSIGSLPQIGRIFRRDHTTVLHAVRARSKLLESVGLDRDADIVAWADALFHALHPNAAT